MKVHFADVGYGEAILVTRDNFVMLIDGGTDWDQEYKNHGCIRIDEYMRKIGVIKVDVVIVTHMHDDHIGGIVRVLKNFQVSEVWINVKPEVPPCDVIKRLETVVVGNLSGILFRNALKSYAELLDECEKRGIPVLQKGSADGRIQLGDDFFIELLSPNEELQSEAAESFDRLFLESNVEKAEQIFNQLDASANSTSISLRLEAGKTAVLLTGDKVDGWDDIYEKYGSRLNSQILKVTHHGQMDGMPEAMVKASQPEIFVVCAPIDRRCNSAHPAIIERANGYLKKADKRGKVYVTGCLGDNGSNSSEICAVSFLCNESTGEISANYAEK